MGPDGSIQRELLPPGALSKSDWLNTIPNKPVTDQHPPDMVNMETCLNLVGGLTPRPRVQRRDCQR